jgi:hypothetical protein
MIGRYPAVSLRQAYETHASLTTNTQCVPKKGAIALTPSSSNSSASRCNHAASANALQQAMCHRPLSLRRS